MNAVCDTALLIVSKGLLVRYTCTEQIQHCCNHCVSIASLKRPVLHTVTLIRNKVSSLKFCPFFHLIQTINAVLALFDEAFCEILDDM